MWYWWSLVDKFWRLNFIYFANNVKAALDDEEFGDEDAPVSAAAVVVLAPEQKIIAVSQTIIPPATAVVVAEKPVPVSSSSSIAEKPVQEVAAITSSPVVEPAAAVKGNWL